MPNCAITDRKYMYVMFKLYMAVCVSVNKWQHIVCLLPYINLWFLVSKHCVSRNESNGSHIWMYINEIILTKWNFTATIL